MVTQTYRHTSNLFYTLSIIGVKEIIDQLLISYSYNPHIFVIRSFGNILSLYFLFSCLLFQPTGLAICLYLSPVLREALP